MYFECFHICLSSTYNYVAMTATDTKGIMSLIEKSNGMFHPAYVVESPNRLNIRFAVYRIEEASGRAFS